jgi:hypothetical protein
MIGYARPSPESVEALVELLAAVQAAQSANAAAPKRIGNESMARAEIGDWLGHIRDDLEEYLDNVNE